MKHKPIFIVGTNRSGTTWLANILANHSNIACVQAEEHFGILETGFFSTLPEYFGDIRDDDNFIVFVEAFSKSDYFVLTGLDKDLFYEKGQLDYPEFLKILMDNYAEKKGADYWLEKTPSHSLHLDEIFRYFPDAKIIGIKRDIISVVKSMVKLHDFSRKHLFRKVFSYFRFNKEIENFASKSNRIMLIEYNDFKKSKEETIRNVCKFLDIEFEHLMLEDRYKPNTSFQNEKGRREALTSLEKIYVRLLASIFSFLPYSFYRIVNKWIPFIRRLYKKPKLISGTYRLFKRKKGMY